MTHYSCAFVRFWVWSLPNTLLKYTKGLGSARAALRIILVIMRSDDFPSVCEREWLANSETNFAKSDPLRPYTCMWFTYDAYKVPAKL